MDFTKEIKTAFELVKLNGNVVSEINKNKDGLLTALIIAAIGGLASGIGMLSLTSMVFGAIGNVVGLFIGAGILYVVAMIFGGKANYMDLVKPIGYAMIVMWASAVPFVGPMLMYLLGIWVIVMDVIIVKSVYNFTTGKAAAVVLIPLAVITIILAILAVVLGAIFMAALFGGATMAGLT